MLKGSKVAIFCHFFELFADIGNLTKNRSEMNGCESWLGCAGEMRAELFEIGRKIKEFKDKLGLVG